MKCKKCGIDKHCSEFYFRGYTIRPSCKECDRLAQKIVSDGSLAASIVARIKADYEARPETKEVAKAYGVSESTAFRAISTVFKAETRGVGIFRKPSGIPVDPRRIADSVLLAIDDAPESHLVRLQMPSRSYARIDHVTEPSLCLGVVGFYRQGITALNVIDDVRERLRELAA